MGSVTVAPFEISLLFPPFIANNSRGIRLCKRLVVVIGYVVIKEELNGL